MKAGGMKTSETSLLEAVLEAAGAAAGEAEAAPRWRRVDSAAMVGREGG